MTSSPERTAFDINGSSALTGKIPKCGNGPNLASDRSLRSGLPFADIFKSALGQTSWKSTGSTNCQIVTTPTAAGEVCVTVFSRNSRLRIEQALPLFPAVAARLSHATATTKELGGVTSSTRSYAITRDRAALIGDASGTVDGVTGQGLSLSLQQALCLAEALDQGNLAHYNSAHRKLAALPATMARLMLLMDGNNWVRRRALRVFQNKPGLFAKLLSIHTGDLPVSSMGTREMADFGWNFLRAWVT